MFYKDTYEPKFVDYDFEWKYSPESIIRILENAGMHHTQFVADKIRDNDVSWILVQWQIKVLKRPEYEQKLTTRTWTSVKSNAVVSDRHYIVCNSDGEECIRARARFALMDVSTGKMTRISPELVALYDPEEKTAFDTDMPRLREYEGYETELNIPIRRSDIDYNGHVHNTKYIDYAIEALPDEVYRANRFDEIHILYKKPVMPGAVLKAKVHREGDRFCFAFTDGSALCTLIEIVI